MSACDVYEHAVESNVAHEDAESDYQHQDSVGKAKCIWNMIAKQVMRNIHHAQMLCELSN